MTKLHTQHEPPELPMAIHPLAQFNGPAEAALKAGETYAKAWLAWQEEIMKFASNRLQWDSRVCEALTKCKSFGDVCEVQKNWLMSTGQDYFEESNRLARFAWGFLPLLVPPAVVTPHRGHEPLHKSAA
jgi:hypothetical protein